MQLLGGAVVVGAVLALYPDAAHRAAELADQEQYGSRVPVEGAA